MRARNLAALFDNRQTPDRQLPDHDPVRMDGIAARRSRPSGSLRSRDDELPAVGRVRAAGRFHRSGYIARGAQLRSLIILHMSYPTLSVGYDICNMADGR